MQLSVSVMLLQNLDVLCDLLLNRPLSTCNLFLPNKL